ncbi:MAG: carbohydrate ABC transporter permease [Clostridia bacterium]|nr:carbohydrate ABC transporter permease [Clostridia bacterium]
MENVVIQNRQNSEAEVLRKQAQRRKTILNVVYYLSGTLLAVVFLFPLVYMLATSTKSESAYASDAGTLMMFLPDFNNLSAAAENYKKVFVSYGVWQYAINSIVYAGVIIVLNIIVNGLAGYVMAKFDFPGKGFFSFIILFLIVVPVETSIIPLYSIVKVLLGMKGTISVLAVILPATISIFNIFLFIQFFEGIPKEYEEAARIDGAGNLRIFFSMILPLSKPIVATVATFCFIGAWNDYLWPTMVLPYAEEGAWPLYPIQSALTSIQSIQGITTGEFMASLVVTSIPIFIVYVVAQKYIVQGFGSAGLKM